MSAVGSRRDHSSIQHTQRPAVWAAAWFIGGILLYRSVPAWPSAWIVIALLFGIGGIIGRRQLLLSGISLGIGLLGLGLAAAQLYAFQFPADSIAAFTTVEARLASLELQIAHTPRIVAPPASAPRMFAPKQVTIAEVTAVRTVSGWRAASGEVSLRILDPLPTLRSGQTIRIVGMLQRPLPAMNEGEFDWAAYYRAQRILATVQVAHAQSIQIVHDPGPSLLEEARDGVRRLLAAGFPASRSLDHALLRALVLGDSDPELQEVQDDFKRTGTSHHLAISGMHIAVLGGLVFWLCRLVRLRPRWAVIVMLSFVVSYGLMALPSPPVMRSVLLCMAIGTGILLGRRVDFVQLLALSVLAMLIYHPLDLFNAGFQLSFGTVLGLMLLTKPMLACLSGANDPDAIALRGLKRPGHFLRMASWADGAVIKAIAAGLVAWAVAFPLIAYHFEQFNIWAILGSIVLAPVVFAALVGGLLKILLTLLWPSLAGVWAAGAAMPIVAMRTGVDWLTRLPRSDVPIPPPAVWLIALFYATLLTALLPCTRPGVRWCLRSARVLAGLAILLLPLETGAVSPNRAPGEMRLTVLSVGAGQCVVIEPPSGRTTLVDAGSTTYADVLSRTIAPFLRHRGCVAVDTIFLSHADFDHIGAAGEIASSYHVREVLIGPRFGGEVLGHSAAGELLQSLRALERPPRVVSQGDLLPLGSDSFIEVLWPSRNVPRLASNDTSMVLRIVHNGASVLLAGDIEDDAMTELLRHPEQLKSDVLVAPHHGSSEKKTAAFVRAVDPAYIVSSDDPSLTFKQKRFERLIGGCPLLRTGHSGAVSIILSAGRDPRVEPFVRPATVP